MIKSIASNVQKNPQYIQELFKLLKQGDDSCEFIMCVFKVKGDTLIHVWPLIDLPDFPNFEKVFLTFELLEKLDIYEVSKK